MTLFEKLRSHDIAELRTTVEEYVEPSSGARHIHLLTDQADLAFLVAFPTVPHNSDGRAHILEHLALSGSQRYPVRNPFFSMMRRSTASFMNAMTYADRTVYPFATTDRNDFFNLLDVYLDATFFPTLDYLNFLQEGWRYTLEDGKLRYQGVVLNEMKGAFTNPLQALYNGITAQLLAGTTYAVVSGGDPLDIPALGYQALKDFHASHYHPSQALFMTAGAMPAAQVQQRIAERVLAQLPGNAPRRLPQLSTVASPRQHTIRVPAQADSASEHGVQSAWILGESADLTALHHAHLLQAGLLGDAAAPLRKALESAGYGRPARIIGMDANARQILFHLGMEGLTHEQLDDARALLQQTLEAVAQTGVPEAALQAALRDIVYQQRDTSGGRMPNILSRMLNAVPAVLRDGDAIDAFDSAAILAQLHRDIARPGFFQGLVRALLGNPARLDAHVLPDPDYFKDRAATEEQRLATIQAGMTPAQIERIGADNRALEELQRAPADATLLPRIRPADLDRQPKALPAVPETRDGKYVFSIASNGISSARMQFDISAMDEADWPWLKLYASLRDGLGVANMSFGQAGAWRRSQVAQFDIGVQPLLDSAGALRLSMNFYASALREDHAQIAAVLDTYVGQPRFDEQARIRFLVELMLRQRRSSLAQEGDRQAHLAASAPLSPLRAFEDASEGAAYSTFLAHLQAQMATEEGYQAVIDRLASLHESLVQCPATVLLAGSGDDAQALAALFKVTPAQDAPARHSTISGKRAALALYAPSQVNHCHIAWKAPDMQHTDAPALAVAAELFQHQFLHQALRERGGAYGGSASYAEGAGTFTMQSYRDPRLGATYADFAEAVERMLDRPFTQEQLEEAIVSAIKKLDHPAAPFAAVLAAWLLHQRGIGTAARQQFRSGVLACTIDDVRQAVARWLTDASASRAASVGNLAQDLAGLDVLDLAASLGAEVQHSA